MSASHSCHPGRRRRRHRQYLRADSRQMHNSVFHSSRSMPPTTLNRILVQRASRPYRTSHPPQVPRATTSKSRTLYSSVGFGASSTTPAAMGSRVCRMVDGRRTFAFARGREYGVMASGVCPRCEYFVQPVSDSSLNSLRFVDNYPSQLFLPRSRQRSRHSRG